MKYEVKTSITEADNLIISSQIPVMTRGVEMLAGQGVVKRGSILAKDNNGKYHLITNNGQMAEGVLTDDIDTNNETIATMYREGHFNRDELIFGGNITKIDELARTLRGINIITDKMV